MIPTITLIVMMAGLANLKNMDNKVSSFARCFYWLFYSLTIVPL
ncbi:hypothetical protein SBDP1_850003 [Syntrophobacter sp. SbD1]|nr:hypothetical protein SBDP1_850003 [Syntrophobacter sp. SbD1]